MRAARTVLFSKGQILMKLPFPPYWNFKTERQLQGLVYMSKIAIGRAAHLLGAEVH